MSKSKLILPQHILDLNPEVAAELEGGVRITRTDTSLGGANDQYRSDLERRVARDWIPAQGYLFWSYEPKQFKLPGGGYTPDFMAVDENLKVMVIEVKGERFNRRASRRAFKELMHFYPEAVYIWIEWKDRDWKVEKWNDQRRTVERNRGLHKIDPRSG